MRNHPKRHSDQFSGPISGNGPFSANDCFQDSDAIPHEHIISKIQLECITFGWASMAQLLERGLWSWVDLSLPLIPPALAVFYTWVCGCIVTGNRILPLNCHSVVKVNESSPSLVTGTWTSYWWSVFGHLQNQQVLSNREETEIC